ncbi:meiotic recombination protein SPO11 [Aethina tumida]|uniref:meiotic recombination protein SPO11 n=1 Tax=Aethina tumida TaxID=116153 RepID=UPI0021482466|nr:meiotic recombination protein SPO11 [Aethina tumida]
MPTLKYRHACWDNCVFLNGRYQFKSKIKKFNIVNFAHNCSKKKFCLMLFLFDKIRKLMIMNTKLTKREIYYQIKSYVRNQSIIDNTLKNISNILDVGLWDLNILAQRGLVYGNMHLKLSSGEIINCNVPGTAIPMDINDIIKIKTAAYFILVVEKESVFHKLIEEDFPNTLAIPFVLITGKGYPNYNTQLFLKKLYTVMSVPVFILVDPDPYGIHIMFTYRFGCRTSAHISEYLTITNAKWLGVFPSEISKMSMSAEELNKKDKNLIQDLLKYPHLSEYPKMREELQILLDHNYKAEIEGFVNNFNYFSRIYLLEKFIEKAFI